MKERNLILDFTGIYAGVPKDFKEISYIDCTDIEGTDMYCTDEAEKEIKRRIRPFGPSGIHFLDSGNYHYVTKFFVDEIKRPFSLVLFDYHNDMQQPMIHDLTSCGSWAGEILKKNTYLRQLIIIGPDKKNLNEISEDLKNKVICISIQELEKQQGEEKSREIDNRVPFYISIDKDVLSKSYAITNWNQGNMSMEMLEILLTFFLVFTDVIGVDICGEYSKAGGNIPEYINAEKINSKTDKALYEYIHSFLDGTGWRGQE